MIRELPEMLSITRVQNEKSLSIVLAKGVSGTDGEELAAIAYQRYGKGKVMSIAANGLWRWAFMPAELERYDEIYTRFWAQMIRWLVYGSDFLSEESEGPQEPQAAGRRDRRLDGAPHRLAEL